MTVGVAEERRARDAAGELRAELAERQMLRAVRTRPNVATSQNAVDPPLPSTTS